MDQPEPATAMPSSVDAPALPRVVASSDLFAGGRVVVIEHAGQQYRLLITRNDRLILQK
jgi:hemin uptake protein HemP